jgi:cysteinyl-tRNA synthetase
MNITDVGHLTGDNEWDADHGEDRMEKGARQQGITARDVAKKFTGIYMEDLTLLHIDSLEYMPKATDHINEQIAMIKELEDKWYTYTIARDGVYMDTSKVEHYGVLINKKHLENLELWSRIQDAGKKNPTDFALWKFNITDKKRDMERDSPRWIGFPGRHIECSAMSMKYLGSHIDIHTWWMEHIAIHHTNEIVQSECSHGHTPRVNYRVHLQWLMLNGKKIAKSDWNVAFLNEVIEKWYTAEDMRYFYLQAHYRSFQDFTREALDVSKKSRLSLIKKIQDGLTPNEQQEQEILWELLNDLNTWWMLWRIHQYGCPQWLDEKVLKLWLFVSTDDQIIDIPQHIQSLADLRRKAKINQDRAQADILRDQLKSQGWTMLDQKDGYELQMI